IDGQEEMLLDDVVYVWFGDSLTKERSIGSGALNELRNDPALLQYESEDQDNWHPSQLHLLTMLGISIARCQEIEHYIAHSFLLGIGDSQKRKYSTFED